VFELVQFLFLDWAGPRLDNTGLVAKLYTDQHTRPYLTVSTCMKSTVIANLDGSVTTHIAHTVGPG